MSRAGTILAVFVLGCQSVPAPPPPEPTGPPVAEPEEVFPEATTVLAERIRARFPGSWLARAVIAIDPSFHERQERHGGGGLLLRLENVSGVAHRPVRVRFGPLDLYATEWIEVAFPATAVPGALVEAEGDIAVRRGGETRRGARVRLEGGSLAVEGEAR